MPKITLFPHQARLIEQTKEFDNVGYFVGMG